LSDTEVPSETFSFKNLLLAMCLEDSHALKVVKYWNSGQICGEINAVTFPMHRQVKLYQLSRRGKAR
jgi:hypothetical protein